MVLTAVRSGEVRGATWGEVEVSRGVWIVPAERMKASQEHRVPLSSRALEVLREAEEFADGSGLVFPSPRSKPLSDSTLSKLLRELGVQAVPHGFRSSFRDWCADTGATQGDCGGGAGAYCSRRRGSIFQERSFRAPKRRDAGLGRLHLRVRTTLTERTET